MNTFMITFQNELVRMLHRRKFLAGLIVAALIPFLVVLVKILAIGFDKTLIYREDLFRLALSFFTPIILPLFSVVLVADTLTDEHSKGSLKTTVLLPDSRTNHFVAKFCSAFTGTAGMMLSLLLSSTLFGFLLASRGGWFIALGISLLQSLASLLPILMVLGFSFLASQFIKTGSGMVLTLIGLTLVLKLSPLWLGSLNGILPTAWLGFGANIVYLSMGSILNALMVMVLWTVLTCGIAIMRFERKMI